MAKLFVEVEDERGVSVHKIANKEVCADFYYGSRERSVRALKVCATVLPTTPEKVAVTTRYVSPHGEVIHTHREEYTMPVTRVLLQEVLV